MPKELYEFLKSKQRITNEDIRKTLLHILEIETHHEEKISLTTEEISEIRQLLSDEKAVIRFAGLFKTVVVSIAATIVAYNVFYDNILIFIIWLSKIITGVS